MTEPWEFRGPMDEESWCERNNHTTIYENGHVLCFECDRGLDDKESD